LKTPSLPFLLIWLFFLVIIGVLGFRRVRTAEEDEKRSAIVQVVVGLVLAVIILVVVNFVF